jgi:hypothetical protein
VTGRHLAVTQLLAHLRASACKEREWCAVMFCSRVSVLCPCYERSGCLVLSLQVCVLALMLHTSNVDDLVKHCLFTASTGQ